MPQGRITHIQCKPGIGGPEKYFEVLKLAKVGAEVGPACPGSIEALDTSVRVNLNIFLFQNVLDICGSLLNVTLNIHSEARSFGDSQSEVQGNDTRNSAKTYEQAPHEIRGYEIGYSFFGENSIFVGSRDNETDQSSS